MSDLEDIFKAQKIFEGLFLDFDRLERDPEYFDQSADYLSTALAREAFEYRDEFNWKMNSKRRLHNRDKQVEEAIDCLTFSINMLLILGVDAEEATEMYFMKRKINLERQIANGNEAAEIIARSESRDMEMQGLP